MEYEHFIDNITMREVGLVAKQKISDDKEHYEMISHAFRVGYISAKKGKDIPMFAKQETPGFISQEDKQNTLAELQAKLGGA